MIRVLAFCLLSSLSAAAMAQHLPESQIPALTGASASSSASRTVSQHVLPLSKARRLSGQLAFEQTLEVSGELSTQTYALAPQQGSLEAFNQAVSALQDSQASLLYRCEGRDCGSSSLWANAVFNDAKLFGVDDQQGYALLRLNTEPEQLISLYAITRGNRRAYLHTQHIAPSQNLGMILPEAATLTYQLRSQARVQFAELTQEPDAQWVALLAASLKHQRTLRVAISGAHAALWRDALVAQGIAAGRLELDEAKDAGLTLTRIR